MGGPKKTPTMDGGQRWLGGGNGGSPPCQGLGDVAPQAYASMASYQGSAVVSGRSMG